MRSLVCFLTRDSLVNEVNEDGEKQTDWPGRREILTGSSSMEILDFEISESLSPSMDFKSKSVFDSDMVDECPPEWSSEDLKF